MKHKYEYVRKSIFSFVALVGIGTSFESKAQFAVIDVGAIAQMAKMIRDNYEHYIMLKRIYSNAKQETDMWKAIHQGVENSSGILESFPILDEGFLAELKSFDRTFAKISEIYGDIPPSPDQVIQLLHDQTAAESIRMMNSSKDYAKTQEENAELLKYQSRTASPKGAARMAAESNAMILHSITQLIRLQGQSLKMQSEQLALRNKHEKQSVKNFQKMNGQFEKGFKNIKIGGDLPRF